MKSTFLALLLSCLGSLFCFLSGHAQTKPVLFEGTVVGGYVNRGGYINCTGPGIKWSRKPYSALFGLLPGLRIKEDRQVMGATKNAMITPSLGFGITAAYRHLALQLPFYYNAKTNLKDGRWHMGIGIGYKL